MSKLSSPLGTLGGPYHEVDSVCDRLVVDLLGLNDSGY